MTRRSWIGSGVVVLGLLMNRRVLGWLAASDGSIESPWLRGIILGAQAVIVLIGIGIVKGRGGSLARRIVGSAPFLLLAALGLSVLAGELLVRMVKGPPARWAPMPTYVGEHVSRPSPNFVPDAEIGWTMRPDHEFRWVIDGEVDDYRSSSEGFRSPYGPSDLLDAEPLIAVVGDSFAWGTGVSYEETFVALLEDRLGAPARVYNLAQPGFGLDQMWLTARHRALPLSPDLLVVAFIDRDLTRSLTAFREAEGMVKPTFVVTEDGLRPQTSDDRPPGLLRWIRRRSAIWGLVSAASVAAGFERPVGRWWTLNAAIMDEMIREVRQAEARVLFVRLPMREARPFPQLARHLQGAGVAYVDLSSNPTEGIHFETDDHINEAGHRHVADAILPAALDVLER